MGKNADAEDGGLKGKWETIRAPLDLARHLMARGEWKFPVLAGMIETPTLRRDGSILQTEGYDPSSQLYFDANGVTFPPIPEKPSRADAIAASERLAQRVGTFPFAPGEGETWDGPTASRAVALSAMLTALVRRSIRAAPAIAIVANTPGTGKSLLSAIVAALASGRAPTAISYGKTQEEFEKRLFSVLLAGDAVVVVDNIEADEVSSDEFCTVLTSETWQNCILGLSRMTTVPTNATFLMNGNNVIFAGDITDRVVQCTLDARMENLRLRVFDNDPVADALAHASIARRGRARRRARPPIVGFPGAVGLPPSRFPDWDKMVRAALVWLGRAGPTVHAR